MAIPGSTALSSKIMAAHYFERVNLPEKMQKQTVGVIAAALAPIQPS